MEYLAEYLYNIDPFFYDIPGVSTYLEKSVHSLFI